MTDLFHRPPRLSQRLGAGALMFASLLLASCSDPRGASKPNFKQVIQAYLDSQPQPLCAELAEAELPVFIARGDRFEARKRQAHDALADAGLLIRKDAEIDEKAGPSGPARKGVPATQYDVTDEGKRYLRPGKKGDFRQGRAEFCFGKLRVVDVTHYTEPADALGVTMSRVDYQQVAEDIPAWATNEAVQAAYPALALHMKAQESKAVLVLTSNGWVHERSLRR